MLEMRPHCEHCQRALAADSTEAWICSFECTFCSECTHQVLHQTCPNCAGQLVVRPTRRNKPTAPEPESKPKPKPNVSQ
ncbi:MAG: DUF1272 domain-containing protein [Burkholderiaceae bacterium]|nr:DUF1272 domain-containing protein [Burkholderiaceae bacterium]